MGSTVSFQPEVYHYIKDKYEDLKKKQIELNLSDEDIYNQMLIIINNANENNTASLSTAIGTNIDSHDKNIAFVFIKPHANNTKTKELVSSTLKNKGLIITKEGSRYTIYVLYTCIYTYYILILL